ncbi:UNVERIFIED_CONTAM: hypothetical protein Scaly_0694600 [Sesamum calycinum]|uniref:Uncharacterized protein n=1 Tax=Sesamum calycinum TaxID=2727403 RepID=A0AAW2R6N6_9LAMI
MVARFSVSRPGARRCHQYAFVHRLREQDFLVASMSKLSIFRRWWRGFALTYYYVARNPIRVIQFSSISIIGRGTGWGWDLERNTITDDPRYLEELYKENPAYKKIVEHGLQRFDLCNQMFSRNTASGGLACSSAVQRRPNHSTNHIDDEQMDGTQSGNRRSRDEYEYTAFSQSPPMTSPDEYFSSPGQAQTSAGPSGSGRRFRRVAGKLQAKKCEIMDRLNESLQGKIDRTSPKATNLLNDA